MPILKGKCFPLAKPVKAVGANETVYVIPHTNEQFVSKVEYDERLALYNESVWTCQCTGAKKLTHQEALESEKRALKQINSTFPVVFEKPILELIHRSVNPLEVLVDRASKRLHEVLVIGEQVALKVTSQGTLLRGVVVKVDASQIEKTNENPSVSPAKSDNSENGADEQRKKYKLLPYKYSVKLDSQDSVVNGIPAGDLQRETHVPNKDLIKLFIRARAVRTTNAFCSTWIVEENYVRKHSLQTKNFLSPNKLNNSVGKSPKEKDTNGLVITKGSRSEEKPKAKRSLENKLNEKSNTKKRSLSIGKKVKKDETSAKKSKKCLLAEDADDLPLAKLAKMPNEGKDNDSIVLAALKKTSKKKMRQENGTGSDMPLSELQNRKTPSSDSSDEDDVVLASLKPKKSMTQEKKSKNAGKTSGKSSPSKTKFKQVTLYQLNCVKKVNASPAKSSPKSTPNKNSSTPNKTPGKSPKNPKSPRQLPPLVARLQKLDKEQNKGLYAQLVGRCVRDLTESQIKSLPIDLRSVLMPKFEQYQEKKKLESMTEAEREAYILKKKEENKQKMRELMKKKMADAKKRYEDTKLDLKPLPVAKLVNTPDGMANELFGDAAMVTEFVSCFKGLLMPDDNTVITTDLLMQALVSGQQGFSLLSKILVVLLQTLLQDQLAEDYKELSCSLSELPVNEYTASELVRLCLRPQDIHDAEDGDGSAIFEEEVPFDVIELLETTEFHELEPSVKLQILVGFCHRIMASYSVQDFMNEKQQDAAELWKKRIAEQKVAKDKRKEDKKSKKDGLLKEGEPGEVKQPTNEQVSGVVKQEGLKKSASAVSLDEMGEDDDDLLSTLKRRRLLLARSAEDKKKKELEDRQLREELRQQRELEAMEKAFKDGILMAKLILRQTSLGLDRNHDRYWLIPSASPGIYIEKGWVSEEANYSICSKTSATESDTDVMETDGCNDGEESYSVLNTTMPHTGQNLWFVLDSLEDFEKLCDSLHPLGVRESSLKASLKNNHDAIVKSLSKVNRSSATQPSIEDDMLEGTRKELEDLEMRLRQGGLGGVPSLERWEKRLMAAKTIKGFAECLLETQAHVVERFVTGMMGKTTKKQCAIKTESGGEEEAESEQQTADEIVDETKSSVTGVQRWLDAVAHCTTFSRFNVLMGMLESCIKWEKSAENAKCKICRKKGQEDRLLLCDECNQAFHLYCLRPALSAVPKGEWYCQSCSPQRSTRCPQDERSSTRNRAARLSSDEEETSDGDLEHETSCAVCGGKSGDLAECSTCVSVFHFDCHLPRIRHYRRSNTWKCMQCVNGVRLKKKRSSRPQRVASKANKRYTYSDDSVSSDDEVAAKRSKRTKASKRYTYSDDEESSNDEVVVKKSSRQVHSSNKRASDMIPPVSKSRNRNSDTAAVTPTTRCRSLTKEESQSADRNTRSRRSDTSSKENRAIDHDVKEAVLNIIDKLIKHRQSWPFIEPVDPIEVPDYHKIVKNSVDLQTMKDRCLSDVYVKPQNFVNDFSLMMKNAELYNEIDSPVYKCISQFEKYFEVLLERHLPQCTYRE